MRLQRFEIEDFGLIERATLELADGLTVLSGETGSGKTMVVGALEFVLGGRASTELIRTGAAAARVTLVVEPDARLRANLRADDFAIEDDEDAIFVRELAAGGKSAARINGRPATTAQLRAVGARLVDLIGQHEQQRLLTASFHAEILDRFAGDAAIELRERVTRAHADVTALEIALTELDRDDGRRAAAVEFARFALTEIDGARLEAAEDEHLRARREYLANAERIAQALALAHDALIDSERAARETLAAAGGALRSIRRFDGRFAALEDQIAILESEASDVALEIARERDLAQFDPAEAEAVGARLDAIDRLKRKYGGSIAAVLTARAEFAEAVADEESKDERRDALTAELATARSELSTASETLSTHRHAAAERLTRAVEAELAALAMPAAQFVVRLEPLAEIGPRGAERIEFALSPNAGEPPRSLSRTASGGELSRILLALVVALADRREPATLVFDEIDAGIGGATAVAVGERIGRLAKTTQVLCVTHLAPIAAWADAHVRLDKDERAGRSRIVAHGLTGDGEVHDEIARMLSGRTTVEALEHAATIVAAAHAGKQTG